jgi:hypothetical protein
MSHAAARADRRDEPTASQGTPSSDPTNVRLKPDYQRPAKRQYSEVHRRAHSIAGGHLENGVDCAAQITCSISKRELAGALGRA